MNSPFTETYDFVVSCDKKDFVFKYKADVSMRVKYSVDGADALPFANTNNIVAATGAGAIPELCDKAGLPDNTLGGTGEKPYYIFKVDFIPVIGGVDDKSIMVTKNILVVAKALDLRTVRCDGTYSSTDMVAKTACSGVDSSGVAYNRDTMVLIQNNTVNVHQVGTNSQTTKLDQRYISCVGSDTMTGVYPLLLLPKVSVTMFPSSYSATIENWAKGKYYKCVDMYGTTNDGSVLTNPVEWMFNLQLSDQQRLLLLLIVLLGIPTLVLAGSRGKRG
jgi:hypothetical protein